MRWRHFAFPWNSAKDGLFFTINGSTEIIQRSGAACNSQYLGENWPPCPKHHPSVTNGFFGWIDYSATFRDVQLSFLDQTLPGPSATEARGSLTPSTTSRLKIHPAKRPNRPPGRWPLRVTSHFYARGELDARLLQTRPTNNEFKSTATRRPTRAGRKSLTISQQLNSAAR